MVEKLISFTFPYFLSFISGVFRTFISEYHVMGMMQPEPQPCRKKRHRVLFAHHRDTKLLSLVCSTVSFCLGGKFLLLQEKAEHHYFPLCA